VDVDHVRLVRRCLKGIAIVVHLHELVERCLRGVSALVPAGRRGASIWAEAGPHQPELTSGIDFWMCDTAENLGRCDTALQKLDAAWGPTEQDWRPVAEQPGWLEPGGPLAVDSEDNRLGRGTGERQAEHACGLHRVRTAEALTITVRSTALLPAGLRGYRGDRSQWLPKAPRAVIAVATSGVTSSCQEGSPEQSRSRTSSLE
jgi:hypothetical protein